MAGGHTGRRRALMPLLVVGLCAAISAGHAAPAQSGANAADPFLQMFDAYAAGDHGVVVRTLTSEDVFKTMLWRYDAAVGRWQASWRGRQPRWSRVYPAFALEIGAVAARQGWANASVLINLAGRFVALRPDRIGDNPDDDAFEVLVHRAGTALTQQMRSPGAVESYARWYQDRISPDRPAIFTRRIVDPRFLLSHAIAGDQRGRHSSVYLANAATRYRDAARFDVNRAEATVRLSWVQHRLGRSADGLQLLDALDAMTAEPEVIYLGRLFRGRLLAALGRIDEAARAYEDALAAWPRAQAPAVALSALYLVDGRHHLSAKWSAVVRTQEAETIDPWWQYWIGEGRFAAARLQAVRRAVPVSSATRTDQP